LVLHEEVNGQKQGGVIDIPGMKFYTGVMRGRFHPDDGHLYLCGMEAWSTSQNIRTGDLYRIRYTNKALTLPVGLAAQNDGVILSFADELDEKQAEDIANYEIKTWDIVRSKRYGSDRYDTQTLNISRVERSQNGKKVKIFLPDIRPTDVMTISYAIKGVNGNSMKGTLQNTIHELTEATVL